MALSKNQLDEIIAGFVSRLSREIHVEQVILCKRQPKTDPP